MSEPESVQTMVRREIKDASEVVLHHSLARADRLRMPCCTERLLEVLAHVVFGNLDHLNAEEEPESYSDPRDPRFREQFGPRVVIRAAADG